MDLFLFITLMVGMTFIFLYCVMSFDLKVKSIKLEEKKLDIRNQELNTEKTTEQK
ncbi:hypothetical protein IMZ31_19685 (plasmid) [Pontibacillus sp. ALD_SL1]|uniref:hypothetical protein n=1 Tax=Pontibacillus sp. ALD_SL1 TaxID=2777185 RepID=UPI001A96746B|nr:hypothetical protein [Pontibacillus sp. ALD_SL1]QST02774.1 hypothetical protein IMZ31_19685 [Pontibacillus sp. ALD_SL1]